MASNLIRFRTPHIQQQLKTGMIFIILLFFLHGKLHAQQDEAQWVDSVYSSLTNTQRIGQLLMVRANESGKPYNQALDALIKKYNLGGVTFFKGDADAQLIQTNRWQQMAQTPMLISIDAEWGIGMRVNHAISYPYQMTLGAIQNNDLITEMGYQIAEQCHRMGIHMNFAPVVDVNDNPENPVIGMRSFGENPNLVAQKGLAYALALQNNGIIPTAKHFPGHGNTQTDSHVTLPIVESSLEALHQSALMPFQSLINHGISGIMVAHIYFPAIETQKNLSSSLSPNVVNDLLKKQMAFEGLIVTDALDMKGATGSATSENIALMALKAGNDILLLPENIPLAIESIQAASEKDPMLAARVEESCRKILRFKYRAGLNAYRPSYVENLNRDLHKRSYKELVKTMFEEAVTVLRNQDQTLPLSSESIGNVALLSVGNDDKSLLLERLLESGIDATVFFLPKKATDTYKNNLQKELQKFDKLIISIENTNILAAKQFGIQKDHVEFVNNLLAEKETIVNLMASPYALSFFNFSNKTKAIVLGYQSEAEAYLAVAKVLTGQLKPKGILPVSVQDFRAGDGLFFSALEKKEDIEISLIDRKYAQKIDSILLEGISKKAYPGCQVVALKDGKIIYDKSFGYHSYDRKDTLKGTDLYDLASITKVLASTLSIMKLHEQGLLSVYDSLGKFFPYLNHTDKGKIRLIDIMTHQSGFDGWIPYYMETMSENGPLNEIYAELPDDEHPLRVAEGMYINSRYRFKIFDKIAQSKLKKAEYRYSDLGYYFVPQIVELVTNIPFEDYVVKNFYEPMELQHTFFRPLAHVPQNEIVPTENDLVFRQQLLHGDVHDQGAAMLGGISGHAGLFSNAREVATLMQMVLNGGTYQGKEYLKAETIQLFTSAPFAKNENRRGIGFDKPPLNPKDKIRMPSMKASAKSFGHSGFTGTFVWADPQNKLIVVFLSNRIHPDSGNQLLMKLSIRTHIHDVFYEAIEASKSLSANE